MKHKVAQLNTEIKINQIKAQQEQRIKKIKNKNNSLIGHMYSDVFILDNYQTVIYTLKLLQVSEKLHEIVCQ